MFSAIMRLSKYVPTFDPDFRTLIPDFKVPCLKDLVLGFIFAHDIIYTFFESIFERYYI